MIFIYMPIVIKLAYACYMCLQILISIVYFDATPAHMFYCYEICNYGYWGEIWNLVSVNVPSYQLD